MKVIICGAGQVGWQIARHLASERNDVTVVDNNPDLVHRATETLDVQGISGFASYPDILERAGANDADMIIAATFSDEVNMVTCQVAHSVFAVPRKIARLRSQSYLRAIYSDLYRRDHLPIDVVISPEREVAEAALQRLAAPAAFDTEYFLQGKAQLLGIALEEDCPVLNTPLRQLTDLFSTLRAIVVGIRREGGLFAPAPGDQLFAGDQVYICAHRNDVPRTMEIRSIAEAAANALERTIVLHGDGLNSELLAEANISRADAVLAVTDDDKTNLLAAVRAKAEGCPMTIALVNDPTLVPLMAPLDVDAYINPRATTVSSILRHIRHGRVRQIYSIGDAEAEVIEAQVLSTSPIAGQKMREVDFPEGVLVGALLKGGEIIRPSGSVRIEEGDVIVIFALTDDVPEVERLLQVSIDFF